jgi:hypothetical protein
MPHPRRGSGIRGAAHPRVRADDRRLRGYDGQDTCDRTPKPGVVGFRTLLNQAYGRRQIDGIERPCGGRTSEHKEGRALDYGLHVTDSNDAAVARDVLDWLLATDQSGNRHAIARRLGIMYIVWIRQTWSANRASAGWRLYQRDNPHADHIHFSFSWPGALQRTTWWTSEPAVPVPVPVPGTGPVTPRPSPLPTRPAPAPSPRRAPVPERQSSRGADTFRNPYNASGMGPRIPANQRVDVSCKVYAPQIKSANPDGYWYRIASAAWSDAYYAVANTFRNGDIPGHPPYTHNTDWSVPAC